MTGFIIKTKDNQTIRFHYYFEDAPLSVAAFQKELPFTLSFYHARTSGQEFWIADAFKFDVIQENASVFIEQGEIVLGPMKPARVKTAGAIGIYYGEGRGLDAANIFGKLFDEDLSFLKTLGEKIWKQGEQELRFEEFEY